MFDYLDISTENLKDKNVEEYLEILHSILGLKSSIEDLKEILNKNKYIITEDNFRKMILILYRIIANIPVILMGETGCGKTSLINILYQLLNNNKEELRKIDINPSYNDNKLTNEMIEVNKEAEKYKGKEFLVFFDELNTCDSMSLITEIFINRTFGGIKLNDKIRLIGACNPYRKKKKNSNTCGLIYPNKEKNNQLVYIVNILPQSLLYYVFNFGSLEKKNEDQYISSIISDSFHDEDLKEKTKNIISKCHDYLRKKIDPSVVSLREIQRFLKIYNFFIEYYKKNMNS